MKKMGWGLGLATAGVVLFASQALAKGTETSSEETRTRTDTSTTTSKSLQGKVEKFDRADNTLTLSGTDKKLKLDPSTQVMKEGERATLDDIKEGDQVRASYSGSGDMLKAKRIDIMPAGSMDTGAPSTTEPSPSTTPSPGTEQGGSSGSKY